MGQELKSQQAQLESERLELQEKFAIAMQDQNISQQTELSILKEELKQKEKLLEQKDEMFKLEEQLDHSDRIYFQKEKSSKAKINVLEESLKHVMEKEDELNEIRAHLQNERVRIARITIASTRKKREIENRNKLRDLGKERKKNAKKKMDIEIKLEQE